jgi:hypothetical protein
MPRGLTTVLFRRGGLFKLVRMDGTDDGVAVIFIQTRPLRGLHFSAHAFANPRKGIDLPLQRAGEGRVKGDALVLEVLAQAHALLAPHGAEDVVIVFAK